MQLKYTGPKEIISAHGISFKKGKDDKYVYIYPAFEIYKALHHNYEKGVVYTFNIEGKRLNDEELLEKILGLNNQIKESFKNQIQEVEDYLNKEIESANEHKYYNKEEIDIYIKNLIIMKNYRTQRQINKIVYNLLIKEIVDEIFGNKIKAINAPFNERFWHILQTIQGELSNHNKRSIGSNLDIVHKEDTITISLKINSIGK